MSPSTTAITDTTGRFHLEGELLLAGFDVAITDAGSHVEKVIGLFGPLEPSTNDG